MKYFLFFSGIVILLWYGCADPASTVQINTKFKDHPPYQGVPKVTQINLNTYRIEISMDVAAIGSSYYAVLAKGSKWVFRDDGKSGDAEYGDRIYTLIYSDHGECVKEIEANLNEFRTALLRNHPIYKCKEGQLIPINKHEILDFERSLRFTKSLIGIRIPMDLLNLPFFLTEKNDNNNYKACNNFTFELPAVKVSLTRR